MILSCARLNSKLAGDECWLVLLWRSCAELPRAAAPQLYAQPQVPQPVYYPPVAEPARPVEAPRYQAPQPYVAPQPQAPVAPLVARPVAAPRLEPPRPVVHAPPPRAIRTQWICPSCSTPNAISSSMCLCCCSEQPVQDDDDVDAPMASTALPSAGAWICTYCRQHNAASATVCRGCNRDKSRPVVGTGAVLFPHTPSSTPAMSAVRHDDFRPASVPTVASASAAVRNLVSAAPAVASEWTCSLCDFNNHASAPSCINCTADRFQ